MGKIDYEDELLICVSVAVDDVSPRAGSDADEVRLAPPDLALTPADWPARTLIEEELFARGA